MQSVPIIVAVCISIIASNALAQLHNDNWVAHMFPNFYPVFVSIQAVIQSHANLRLKFKRQPEAWNPSGTKCLGLHQALLSLCIFWPKRKRKRESNANEVHTIDIYCSKTYIYKQNTKRNVTQTQNIKQKKTTQSESAWAFGKNAWSQAALFKQFANAVT